ncbi:hypothetical protein K1719_013419 [Acacia pycnantha]|nr:hypothetical protein K1719_013419 [Acacia pycnantha]
MEEIVISIVEKVVGCVAGSILQSARYWFCFKQFIKKLENAKQELEVKLAGMKKRKEEADRKTEEIMPYVKKWLDEVNAVLDEVQKLQQKLEGGRIKCFNVSLRYSLAKSMDDKAMRMMELINKKNSEFEPFSICTQLRGITYFSSKEFMNFNSRELKCNELLEAIKDGENKTIGLYGMGGSGKTTLAKEIGKKVEELKLFEKVVMAVISKSPNVFNIQQEIAEQIGLELKETSELNRPQRLSMGLKNKKILIILDDVWSELSFEDIGIPLNEGCCVLLTTRRRDVCVSMNCKSIIELTLLTEEEARALFKMRANITNVSMNEFDSIGRKIVDECKGLPIAIVTIGSTLKGKSIQEWKSMLRRLQHPPSVDIEDNLKKSYTILEVSYENLPNLQAKSLFLLCSVFPEDHEIHIEDLIRFGKGILELGENIYTMQQARIEILATIKKLLDSCLLMNTKKQAFVKMHDVVRDVALWIRKKKGQEVLVDNHAASNMLVNDHQSLKDIKALSLWGLTNNFRFSGQLRCPTLEILILQPYGFIEDLEAIEALKVLALITYRFGWDFSQFSSLSRRFCLIPQSIASSTNLHTLCLRGKRMGDISFLGELKRLEILDLRGSTFLELPTGIVDMKNLKLLDVYDCIINKSPLEVIQKCMQLEELYLWDSNSVISENFSLSRLKRYVIIDSTCTIVERPNAIQLIQKYIFKSDIKYHKSAPFVEYFDGSIEALTSLSLHGLKLSDVGSSLKHLILQADYLWLQNCEWDHKDINFEIKCLGVLYCKERRTVIDGDILQRQQVFSHLINLRLEQMDSLEQVFQNSSITCSLPMLQELHIKSCPKLITVFSHATISSLPKLKKLEIVYCEQVRWLFSYSQASHCPSLEKISIVACYGLEKLVDEEASHRNLGTHHEMLFPKLNYLRLVNLPKLGEIYPGYEFNLLFGTIHMQGCPKLRNIPLEYKASSSDLEIKSKVLIPLAPKSDHAIRAGDHSAETDTGAAEDQQKQSCTMLLEPSKIRSTSSSDRASFSVKPRHVYIISSSFHIRLEKRAKG